MNGASGARGIALQVLISMRAAGAWSDAALQSRLEAAKLPPQERALATNLVYGVLQNRLLLDFWIGQFCTQKPDHLQYPLLDILRLGVYQIVFLDRIPDSAAVNESVNLTREAGRAPAAGLVNAVLRKAAANKGNLPMPQGEDAVKVLSITYSHPRWLVKRLLGLLGRQEAEAFLRLDNQVAPLTVQVNPLKTTAEALQKELSAAGIAAAVHPWVPGCLELSGTGNPAALPAFREGRFFIQDGAASLVALAAGVRPGDRVVDVCAAPGGKSFGAALAMGDRGSILACDLYPNKLSRIREGAARLGIGCITAAAADARQPRPELAGSADAVLVDAPCSGLGIIRKKPEIRYKNPDELFALPVIQTEILRSAADIVRPGGTLLYSTCTVVPEENQQITDAFLSEHPDFTRESFTLPQPVGAVPEGEITLWPQRHGTDGFYLCRMKRAAL
jgi:16S rRNA (cytosine967-C5)-methyltransferase